MSVAIDFVRCLVIRDSVRPEQIVQCPLFMARVSVEGTGLNRLECRKAEISALVDLDFMELQARFCRLLVVWDVGCGFWAGYIFQRLLVWLRWPMMIMFPSLIILKLYLEKIAVR